MYSSITVNDIKTDDLSFPTLESDVKDHIDYVLEAYAPFSDVQLERMTHNEQPWLDARDGYEPFQRCEEEIDEITMRNYYAARVS